MKPKKLDKKPAKGGRIISEGGEAASFDPSKPLDNQQHEAFARLIADGKGNSEAYTQVYGAPPAQAKANGARLIAKDSVSARVGHLQGLAEDATVLGIREKRQFYAAIVRTPIGDIDDRHQLCQSVKRTESDGGGSIEYKMPDKLRATQLDSELAVHIKSDGSKVNVGVSVSVTVMTDEKRQRLIELKRQANEDNKIGLS